MLFYEYNVVHCAVRRADTLTERRSDRAGLGHHASPLRMSVPGRREWGQCQASSPGGVCSLLLLLLRLFQAAEGVLA